MRILPPNTKLPENPIERRHNPEPAVGKDGYRAYRSCLRWEFGFSCAFCLLHEADIATHGAEGWAVTWVEHYRLVSNRPDEANEYANCFYSCRLCNRARSVAPIVDNQGRQLLNPCDHAWAEHFEAKNDELRPRPGDADAEYTHASYHLDSQEKVMMRRRRREKLTECFALIEEGPAKIQRLIDRADSESLRAATLLRRGIKLAAMTVEHYLAIPKDADTRCRCKGRDKRSLPPELEKQTIDIKVPEVG